MNCSHVGMKQTCEKVARLVWFCGAARAAFLRATGSQSVQVRLNANYSYIFLHVEISLSGTPTPVHGHKSILALAVRLSCCGRDGISCQSPHSQGGACVS